MTKAQTPRHLVQSRSRIDFCTRKIRLLRRETPGRDDRDGPDLADYLQSQVSTGVEHPSLHATFTHDALTGDVSRTIAT